VLFRSLCLFVLFVFFAFAHAQSDPNLFQMVLEKDGNMSQAFNEGNATKFASFYDVKAHLMPPGDEDLIGRDAIAAFAQGMIDSGVKTATFTPLEVDHIHRSPVQDWAYERGTYELQLADGSVFDQGNYVVVWYRGGLKHYWTAYYDIFVSSMPAPAAYPRVDGSKRKPLELAGGPMVPADDALMQAISNGNDEWMSAYASGQPQDVANCYCSNGTVLANHQASPISGQSAIADFFQGAMSSGVATIDLTIVEVNVAYDDGVAYEKSTYVFKDQFGNPLDTGKYIVIWRMEDDAFHLYIDCFNSDKAQ